VWLAGAFAVLALLGVFAFVDDPRLASLLEESIIVVVFVVASAVLAGAWTHTRDMERRFWGFLLVGTMFLTAARSYEVLSLAGMRLSWLPSGEAISGMFEMAAVASLLGLLTTFSRFRKSSVAAQVRYVVDVAAMCLVVAGAFEIWVLGPWYDSLGPVSVWARMVYSVSPVVGALAFVGMLGGVLGTRWERWESWERLLVLSMVALAAGLILAPVAHADTSWAVMGGWARALSESAWLSGGVLVIAGAVYRHIEESRQWMLRPLAVLEPRYGFASAVALPTVQVLALLVFGLAAAGAQDPGTRAVRLGIVGWIALTVAVRTLLTVADTHALASGVVDDALTGLRSHRHMHRALGNEIASAVRYGEPLSVIALDVDDFARVNAVAGHGAGDDVLVSVARAIDRAVRTRDIVSRAGGDEFVVLLPGADEMVAEQVAARVLGEIQELSVPGVGHLSASAGVSGLPAADGDELLRRAEDALYQARAVQPGSVAVFDPAALVSMDPDERARVLSDRGDTLTVRALAAAVDARDEATQDHSRNVARYAVLLAREIGLDERTVLHVEYAALLHDVGKIGLPDDLLRKPTHFNSSERERMQTHAALGEEILQSTAMRDILPWVRNHHERWDGTGYPDGMSGEGIPLGARILALADAYDAMRSDRPHRSGLSRTAALQEIDLGLGTAFDPALGERFIDAIGRTFQ
jgi:diguanylate cyclase (GGDEF)-like protein/putative nucleotidyltransferase with HDIG domain